MATKFITVSIEIMHDKNLTPNQKFILAEIEQLCSLEHGCFATNRHFSELIGIKVQGVSNAINDLAKKGYINIDNSKTKRNNGRIITIHQNVPPIHSNVPPIHSNVESKENKTTNKTINNKNNTKSFGFKLSKVTQYENLSQEYKQNLLAYAVTKVGNRANDMLNAMIDYHTSNGKGFKDWSASFRTWLRNSEKFNGAKSYYKPKEPEIGSLAWEMAQQQKNDNAIDVEVDDE